MIDFIIKGHEDIVREISKEELISKLGDKANLDLISLILDKQEDLEVTYYKNSNVYRFDFVNIVNLLENMNNKNVFNMLSNDKYLFNIEFDLSNNKFICLDVMEGISKLINSDLSEVKKIECIKMFKAFQSHLKNKGFILEMIKDDSMLSLVHKNLSELTVNELSEAISEIEDYNYDINMATEMLFI